MRHQIVTLSLALALSATAVAHAADRDNDRDDDLYKVIDVLARDVGILGVFSDWAAPVTFYANCMGLR